MEKVVKIDKQIFDKLLEMSLSTDSSNHIVVKGILENIDIEDNIIYILCLYKEINTTYKHGIFSDIKDKISKAYPKILNEYGQYTNCTWDDIYNYAVTLQNEDFKSAVACIYSKSLQNTLESIGYDFLKKYNITLVPKE